MAVIHLWMDTRRSKFQALLPQDLELNALALELFYHACRNWSSPQPALDLQPGLIIDQISLTNPFDLWGYMRSVSLVLANEVLDRTLFYQTENERRRAEVGRIRQGEISDKLDNIRKANALRDELVARGADPIEVTKLLALIISDQEANIEVLHGSHRKQPLPPGHL
jgi:hypothetical protein